MTAGVLGSTAVVTWRVPVAGDDGLSGNGMQPGCTFGFFAVGKETEGEEEGEPKWRGEK